MGARGGMSDSGNLLTSNINPVLSFSGFVQEHSIRSIEFFGSPPCLSNHVSLPSMGSNSNHLVAHRLNQPFSGSFSAERIVV